MKIYKRHLSVRSLTFFCLGTLVRCPYTLQVFLGMEEFIGKTVSYNIHMLSVTPTLSF